MMAVVVGLQEGLSRDEYMGSAHGDRVASRTIANPTN